VRSTPTERPLHTHGTRYTRSSIPTAFRGVATLPHRQADSDILEEIILTLARYAHSSPPRPPRTSLITNNANMSNATNTARSLLAVQSTSLSSCSSIRALRLICAIRDFSQRVVAFLGVRCALRVSMLFVPRSKFYVHRAFRILGSYFRTSPSSRITHYLSPFLPQ